MSTNKLVLSCLRPTKELFLLMSALMSVIVLATLATFFSSQQLTAVAAFLVADTIVVMIITRKTRRVRLVDAISHTCWQMAICILIASKSGSFFLISMLSIAASSAVVLMNRKRNRHRILLHIRTISGIIMVCAAFSF